MVGLARRGSSPVPKRSNVADLVGGGLAKAYRNSDVAVAGDGHTPAQRQKKLYRGDSEVINEDSMTRGISPDFDDVYIH